MPEYTLLSELLTLCFDTVAIGGGVYLVIGLALSLLHSWQSCVPIAPAKETAEIQLGSGQPVKEDPAFAMSGSRDELSRLAWFEKNIVERQSTKIQPAS